MGASLLWVPTQVPLLALQLEPEQLGFSLLYQFLQNWYFCETPQWVKPTEMGCRVNPSFLPQKAALSSAAVPGAHAGVWVVGLSVG